MSGTGLSNTHISACDGRASTMEVKRMRDSGYFGPGHEGKCIVDYFPQEPHASKSGFPRRF